MTRIIQWEPEFRPQPKARKPARSASYLDFVRSKPCCVCPSGTPFDRSHAHHDGPRGMGQKTSDFRVLPLCAEHHAAEHAGRLPQFDAEAKAVVMRELLVEFLEVSGV